MSTQPQTSLSFASLRQNSQYHNQHHQPQHQSGHRQSISNTINPDASASSAPGPHISSFTHSHQHSYAAAADHHLLSSSLGTNSASLAHMARLQSHFAQLAPSCSAHLADQNAIPILSTTPHPGSQALSSLSAAYVQAHDTASRMGLGVPLRVTLSTGSGAAVIQTGTLPVGGDDESQDGDHHGDGHLGGHGENLMLVGTVIAPVDRLADARIASWGVEDVARKFQKYMHDGK